MTELKYNKNEKKKKIKKSEALSVSICFGILIIFKLKEISGHVYFFKGKQISPHVTSTKSHITDTKGGKIFKNLFTIGITLSVMYVVAESSPQMLVKTMKLLEYRMIGK